MWIFEFKREKRRNKVAKGDVTTRHTDKSNNVLSFGFHMFHKKYKKYKKFTVERRQHEIRLVFISFPSSKRPSWEEEDFLDEIILL
jgi:hypothetical protein